MPVGDASPPVEDPLIGRVLSERYRILRKIGEGGMGTVYQAEHALIEKKIALKVLFPELTRRANLVARFLQEAKSASRIGHENVIDISDFGQSPEGMVYIAMEYLEGQDLGRVVKAEGSLPWPRARGILMQVAKALRAAHEHGIIHRDMKPENIYLIQREGRQDFVKVLDFGIAKVVSPDADGPHLTQAGMIFGTPEYMSPEQAQGLPPDHRVDIYAVGCLMYNVLTGEVPFKADSFMGILTKHMLEPPVPLRQRRPDLDIPGEAEAVCMRALEKDRDKRWQDMDAFYRALGAAGGEPFEPSGIYASHSSFRPAGGSQPNPTTSALKTEALPLPAARERAAPGPGAGMKIGVVAVAVVVVAALLVMALRMSARKAAEPAPPAPEPAAVAPPGAVAPLPAVRVVGPAAPSESAPAAEPPKPARPKRRPNADVNKGARKEGAAPETGPTPGEGAPSTPAELKNPFGNP